MAPTVLCTCVMLKTYCAWPTSKNGKQHACTWRGLLPEACTSASILITRTSKQGTLIFGKSHLWLGFKVVETGVGCARVLARLWNRCRAHVIWGYFVKKTRQPGPTRLVKLRQSTGLGNFYAQGLGLRALRAFGFFGFGCGL